MSVVDLVKFLLAKMAMCIVCEYVIYFCKTPTTVVPVCHPSTLHKLKRAKLAPQVFESM